MLTGTSCCPGVVEGEVRVVRTVEEAKVRGTDRLTDRLTVTLFSFFSRGWRVRFWLRLALTLVGYHSTRCAPDWSLREGGGPMCRSHDHHMQIT